MKKDVALFVVVVLGLGVDGDGPEVDRMVPCEDATSVGAAIGKVDIDEQTWELFEIVGGKYRRRSVTFEAGGGVTVR